MRWRVKKKDKHLDRFKLELDGEGESESECAEQFSAELEFDSWYCFR